MGNTKAQYNKGLSTLDANARLLKYGPNEINDKKTGLIKKIFSPVLSPFSLLMIASGILSYLNNRLFDCYLICILYCINYFIQKWQEFKADESMQELQKRLLFEVLTLRDGNWSYIPAKYLVPGDYVKLNLGNIIPADATVLSQANLSVNEAVITGESMPLHKKKGDTIYSGSFIATGNLDAEITATGKYTRFGKTIYSIEQPKSKSLLEKDILSIASFLSIISIVAIFILSIVSKFVFKHASLDIMTLDLSLMLAGIPIAMPTVMGVILSVGAAELAQKSVIVRRLSALHDLANVDMLLTDKTGTLTKNEISITNVVSFNKNFNSNDIIELAMHTVNKDTPDAIDLAIMQKSGKTHKHLNSSLKILRMIPYDATRKRSTAFLKENGHKLVVSVGAPQVLEKLSKKACLAKFNQDIVKAAKNGFRVLAVAINKSSFIEANMNLIGILFLSDTLEKSSKDVIGFMKHNGIDVKIMTGDNEVITKRIVQELGIKGSVLGAPETNHFYTVKNITSNNVAAFSEMLPEDKYKLVQAFKNNYYTVAATGDGINDLPSLKIANVGIAVSGAVTALKSLADIVLLGNGLSVIKDAILGSREIFARIYNYSIYRISESFRLIITILILSLTYGLHPLEPIQLIFIALLNDIPIVSLAVDRVEIASAPSKIMVKQRFILSTMFGLVGVLNSVIFVTLMIKFWHISLPVLQTMFFLKLTLSGHALIFVAHTKRRWYKFLPSNAVIASTIGTQLFATILAITGVLMPAKISFFAALLIWVWTFFWMQISELTKDLQAKFMCN